MRLILLMSASLFLSGCSEWSKDLTEQLVSDDVIKINYEKYRLSNGLTVVLHKDNSHPLVHVDMTYHVGSAREEMGKSGFAHFFEHMMFQGSEHVLDQAHFKLITQAGGELNGSTNRDRTNYYQTVPANELEKVIWLEADRMGFLLNAVSKKKFEIQRDTVKNERAQNYDNRPYGLVGETLAAALYPDGHPYSWPTIGYVDDLNQVTVDDLKAFFLRWYGPNNATLTIGGDIDIEKTKAWIAKYFDEIPRGPEVKKAEKRPVTLAEPRFVTLEDNIEQPMLLMAWPTDYLDSEQSLSLDLLGAVLGQGRNSVLYQSLVKPQKVLSASAYQVCGELACYFQVSIVVKKGQALAPIYQEVMDILDRFKKEGVSAESLDQLKGMEEANTIFSLESVQGKVMQLASNQVFFDEPDRLDFWLSRLNAVSVDEVNAAFNTYIWKKNEVTLSVIPKREATLVAKKANFSYVRPITEIQTPSSQSSTENRVTPKTFDRNIMPSATAPVNAHVPEIYQTQLTNGIKVNGVETTETPTVAIHIQLPAGYLMEPEGKNGLAGLTAKMMMEGSQGFSSEAITAKLDLLGSTVDFSTAATTTTLTITSLKKHLDETLALAEEILFKPKFTQKDFERLKTRALESLQFRQLDPSWLAAQARREVMYSDPWFSLPASGDRQSLTSLTLADVNAFYAKHYSPHDARAISVGDITEKSLIKALAGLDTWQGKQASLPHRPELKMYPSSQIWLVDKPDAPQSVVQFVRHGMLFDATGDMFKTQLANFNLAGNFNSRLNQNLREEKGYTYGASGSVVGSDLSGLIVFQTKVREDATLDTIKEIERELNDFATKGVTREELDFMRLAVGQSDALNYETPSDNAGLIALMMRYGLSQSFKETQNKIVEAVDKKEIDRLAKQWFMPKDYQIIVVGDGKKLSPQLKTLSIPIKQLDIEI